MAVSVLDSFIAVSCVGLFFCDCGIILSYLLVFVLMGFLITDVLVSFPLLSVCLFVCLTVIKDGPWFVFVRLPGHVHLIFILVSNTNA